MISYTEGLVVYYLWGRASHFAGGHFKILTGYWGSFLEKGLFAGGHFY